MTSMVGSGSPARHPFVGVFAFAALTASLSEHVVGEPAALKSSTIIMAASAFAVKICMHNVHNANAAKSSMVLSLFIACLCLYMLSYNIVEGMFFGKPTDAKCCKYCNLRKVDNS
jgi:uncharacterized PurR-regulated membrane protein YhhQ (DUF165 family)